MSCRLVIAAALLLGTAARAESSKIFAIGGTVGLPQLEALELRYTGFKQIEFGMGFGVLPQLDAFLKRKVDTYLNNNISADKRELVLQAGQTSLILPSSSFKLTGFSPFVRIYPWGGPFYAQLGYTIWRFRGSIMGDVQNETTGTVSYGLISGSADLNQPVITAAIGWKHRFLGSLYFDFGFGAFSLQPAKSSISIGGTVASLANVLPDAQAKLDSTQTEINQKVAAALTDLRRKLVLLPALYLAAGFEF
jgi:hypothetical protein